MAEGNDKCEKCDKLFTGRATKQRIRCETCKCNFHWKCAGLTEDEFAVAESAIAIHGMFWNCRVCTKFRKSLINRMMETEEEVKRLREDMENMRDALGARILALENAEKAQPAKSVESVTNIIQSVRLSVNEQLDRKSNIIVRDLPESLEETTEARKDSDISQIAQALHIRKEVITGAFRAGKKREDARNPRIIVVRLRSPEEREEVLRRGTKQNGLRVGPDLSKQEREDDNDFFLRIDQHKKNVGSDEVFRVVGPPGRRNLLDRTGRRIKLKAVTPNSTQG